MFVSETSEAELHDELLASPKPHSHFVQFYEADDHLLARNVSLYLGQGLQRGEGVLVVAAAEHCDAFARQLSQLGIDAQAALIGGQLTFLDAREMLGTFMVDRKPDHARFQKSVGCVVREMRERIGFAGLRVYGEMVGILWSSGQYSAAFQVEEFWNELLESVDFSLFCGYPIDVFGREFQADSIYALLCDHTHVLPAGANNDMERAVSQAMAEILAWSGQDLQPGTKTGRPSAWAALPSAESKILWLRNNAPDSADDVLTRARQLYQGLRANASNAGQ